MKKLVILLFVASFFFLFFSCKKEHSGAVTTPAGKKYAVTFNVLNFTQKQTTFALRHKASHLADTLTNLNTYFDVLYYMVYDQPYPNPPTIITQDSTMSNMGTIVDSLAPGSYKVIILAGKKGLGYTEPERLTDATYGYGGKWQDAFYYTANVTVGSGSTNFAVTLQREVGKLELNIFDNIPATADSLSFTINPELTDKILNSGFNDYGSTQQVITFTEAIPAGAKGKPNFVMDRIIGNTYLPFTVTIVCKTASNQILGTAIANNVSCVANQRTILSGNLFSGSSSTQSFTAKIDTAWNSNSNQYNF